MTWHVPDRDQDRRIWAENHKNGIAWFAANEADYADMRPGYDRYVADMRDLGDEPVSFAVWLEATFDRWDDLRMMANGNAPADAGARA
jgi:hypothetical protein